MPKFKILITSRSFSSGSLDLVAFLSKNNCDAVFADSKHELTELKPVLIDAVGWIAGTAKITAEMMDLAPNLKIIARYGVGFESVDLQAAKARSILVTNTPGANSLAVAELTLGLTFTALRGINQSAVQVHEGNWQVIRGKQLEGSIVGIIGFGRIGKILATKFQSLGCEIWIADPFVPEREIQSKGFLAKTSEEIAAVAMIVSLNAPGDSVIIDENWVINCRNQQIIINSARAELVDETAIANGLRNNQLFAYAADTLQGEKNSSNSPLLATDIASKVTITAHLGAQTVEAIDLMGKIASDNVIAVLNGKSALNPVN